MNSLTDLQWLLIQAGAALLVLISIIWIAAGRGHRVQAVPNDPSTLPEYDSLDFGVEVQFRPFRGASWQAVPATILVRNVTASVVSLTPDRASTSRELPTAQFSLTGVSAGEGKFRISATPLGHKKGIGRNFPVSVTPNANNRRAIRHTPAALAASVWKE